jgi:hypothetical protein
MKCNSYPESTDEVEQHQALVLASFTGNASHRMPTTGRDAGDDPLGTIGGLLTALLIFAVLWLAYGRLGYWR